MTHVMVYGCTVDDSGAALEMGETSFRDVKHGENVDVEGILKLFRRQFLERRLFELCSSIIDQNLKISQPFLCLRNNLFAILKPISPRISEASIVPLLHEYRVE